MKVYALDTETTGLIPNRGITIDALPEVTEYYGALVDLKKGKVLRDVEALVKPSRYPIPEAVLKETKTVITNDMLKGAPPFASVAPMIKKEIEGAPFVLAHNASFDQEMLNIEFERLGETVEWPPLICTVEQTVHVKGFRLSLTMLHVELFGEPFPEAHRAKPDTQALIRCAVELFRRGLL